MGKSPAIFLFDGGRFLLFLYFATQALLVIFFNALIGLAISAVYKYCDAVIKTFATATVTVLLVIFRYDLISLIFSYERKEYGGHVV